MLSKEENELITTTGPGTPMGKLMREYWLPALLSSEVPTPDSDPVRVLLLGEKLIAFRDTNGGVGLLDHNCPHRGASLFFGRTEECGIRCVYHGWKFDSSGRCVDMPNEPAESDFKDRVKANAYPTRERNGVVWAYLGQRSEPPPLPHLEGNMLPEGTWSATAVQRECNWLQALEGDIDTSHFSFLHAGSMKAGSQPEGSFSYYMLADRAPRYSLLDTEYGTMYGAYRDTNDGRRYWRIAQHLFPCFTMPPQGVLGNKVTVRCWVPMDDTHTMFFMMGPATRRSIARFLPPSTDWYGRFRLATNSTNDYEIDRAKQRRNSNMEDFTGITGIHLQDQAITESMGEVYDRGKEHLGSSDTMVIRVRRRLLEAARALEERGETPPAVDTPEVYGARAGGVFLAKDADWIKDTEELRRGFVHHPELDLTVTGPLV